MKSNELTVGDWVNYWNTDDGHAPYIDAIKIEKDDFGLDEDVFFQLIEPIQITQEILERNGFVKCIGGRSKKSLQLIGDGLYVSWWNDRIVIRYKRAIGHPSAYLNCDCRYVHELQHTLRMAGIEKEIVL